MKEFKFVNRTSELQTLEKLYNQPGFQFVPIYGRRRVGKTRLIKEFIRNKKAIYFLSDSIPQTQQLKNLGQSVGEFFNDVILMQNGFTSWDQFFVYINEKAQRQRIIFVIDEFPYLVIANSAIATIFQKGIDEYLKQTELFLVLMGSSIGMMEKEVLHYKAPLYGRRTASIEVKEMNLLSIHEMFPDKSFSDVIRLYAIFGTIPAYLEKINPRKDVFSIIKDSILEKYSFLYNEVDFILREEFREPHNYFVILKSIALGKHKLSEIVNDTGFEKTMVSRYLDILRSLHIIKKEIPITENNPEKSKGIYKLYDKYFNFWFKFIFPNRRWIELDQTDIVLKKIKEEFEHHVSLVFEDACIELCYSLMKKNIMQFTRIGSWWSKTDQIDIVALDDSSNTIWFGECKWSNKKVGTNIYYDLLKKSHNIYYYPVNQKNKYILFSKSGFTSDMIMIAKTNDVLLVDINEILDFIT